MKILPLLFVLAASSGPAAALPQETANPEPSLRRLLLDGEAEAMGSARRALADAGAQGRRRLAELAARVEEVADALLGEEKELVLMLPAARVADPFRAAVEDLLSTDKDTAARAVEQLAAKGEGAVETVRGLLRRTWELQEEFLVHFFFGQMESGVLFQGQYAPVADLGPRAARLVLRWAEDPPKAARNRAAFRTACLHALRDLETVGATSAAHKEQAVEIVRKIATDDYDDASVRETAAYVLALLGDRSVVEERIASVRKLMEEQEDDQLRADAWYTLAGIHHSLREYKEAADAWRRFWELTDVERIPAHTLPTRYYNAACAMALAGHPDEAFDFLEKAMEAGRRGGQSLRRQLFETDPEINALRSDPRFQEFFSRYFGRPPERRGPPSGGGGEGPDRGAGGR